MAQDERADLAGHGLKLLQHGQHEHRRLAHAGLGLADHVHPQNRLRDALVLHCDGREEEEKRGGNLRGDRGGKRQQERKVSSRSQVLGSAAKTPRRSMLRRRPLRPPTGSSDRARAARARQRIGAIINPLGHFLAACFRKNNCWGF